MRVPAKARFFCFFFFFVAVTVPVLLLSSTQTTAFSVESRNATLSCDGRGWSEECLVTGEEEDGVALDSYPDIKAKGNGQIVFRTPNKGQPVVDNCPRSNTGCLLDKKNNPPPGEKCGTGIYNRVCMNRR